MNYQTLVLNADFRPLNFFPLSTIEWQRAVKGIFEETHIVVAEYDQVIRSPSTTMRIPSVIAVRSFVPTPKHVAFTRFNVFLRDRFTCQYCNQKFASQDLRFDHVHPRAKGGVTSWDNIVAACEPCNTLKGDKFTMTPIKPPVKPTIGDLIKAKMEFPPRHLHETWTDFLYWSVPLEA